MDMSITLASYSITVFIRCCGNLVYLICLNSSVSLTTNMSASYADDEECHSEDEKLLNTDFIMLIYLESPIAVTVL